MTRITLSPAIDNYLIEMDWRDNARLDEKFSKELVSRYEEGCVILLRNAPLRLDYDLVRRVMVPPSASTKKLDEALFVRPKLRRPRDLHTLYQIFGPHLPFYLQVRSEMREFSAQIKNLIQGIFPYKFSSENISWRLTKTGPEHMHLDFFGSKKDIQYVRMFVNIDDRPRIWNTSHRIDELAARYYKTAGLDRLRERSGDEFCEALTKAAFGWKANAGQDGHDRHAIEFETGDVWLCESRIVSHQVLSGFRAVSAKFRADPQTMLNPELRLESRVKRFHTMYAS